MQSFATKLKLAGLDVTTVADYQADGSIASVQRVMNIGRLCIVKNVWLVPRLLAPGQNYRVFKMLLTAKRNYVRVKSKGLSMVMPLFGDEAGPKRGQMVLVCSCRGGDKRRFN